VLKIGNRSRLGRALAGLQVGIGRRSRAAFAPQRPHGITPAASSFCNTSCAASIAPAFSRRHSRGRLAS
jgi:hypothetical protein